MSRVVCKVGGSLLDLPELGLRLLELCQRQSPVQILLVIGGGVAADLVRVWQQQQDLSDEAAHWLALQAAELNARFILTLSDRFTGVATLQQANAVWQAGHYAVLLPHAALQMAELTADNPLPHNWDVTTDSVAAWIAREWRADSLLLLKSTSPPAGCNLEMTAQLGLVDGYFATAIRGIPEVRWMNFREAGLAPLE